MTLYEKLPVEFLIRFYHEILKNIEQGILTKTMYYELGIIIFVANQRGIALDHPSDFHQIINQQCLNQLLHLEQIDGKPYIA
ncbi:hypothetical protein [Bacillus sp. Marseille-P3661]|uniref:hypothetical protein n=1 Tax=Bacillus sp. Marseille-P3661 TaxID=1936234 RepID=UPI000C863269|nr:hypothetical protein [Bacillus sp. Marseille-P3661]